MISRFGGMPPHRRRRSDRFPMEADVELVEPEAGRGKLLDASADGLRVAIDRLVRVGDVHLAVLRTRQGQEHRDRVRVVWTRPRDGSGCTAGLAFLER